MAHKKAKNFEEAWDLCEKENIGVPYAGLQWKGTDACIDVHCKCGAHFHLDSYFLYTIKCGHCKRVYACNERIELIELEDKSDFTIVGYDD